MPFATQNQLNSLEIHEKIKEEPPMTTAHYLVTAGVGSASMKKLSCLFVLISQFLDERHNIIFRGQAGAFCFSGHFLLKHLHGIHSRIDNADGVSLDDKSDPITV